MTLLLQYIAPFTTYIIGIVSFVGTVLALFVGWQGLLKGRAETRKIFIETEAKKDELQTRLKQAKNDALEIKFESIKLDQGNSEWREYSINNLFDDQEEKIEAAKSRLGSTVDFANLRYFEISGPYYISTPSFEIVITNISRSEVLLDEISVKIYYISTEGNDMEGGGGREGVYKLPSSKIYKIDVSNFCNGTHYESDLYDGFYWLNEWVCDQTLRPRIFEPYTFAAGARFRYKIALINWPISASALLCMRVKTGSTEILSSPLFIRYGGDIWGHRRKSG